MKILHVVPYLHPAAGGPPVVVRRLARESAARGHSVQVLTTDSLAPEHDRDWVADLRREPFEIEIFRSVCRTPFALSPDLHRHLFAAVRGADVVHIHGLWTFAGWSAMKACLRHGRPYVVMPHGMLDPASLRRKAWKKSAYGWLVERPMLRRARAMIYTHAEERRLAEAATSGLPTGRVIRLGADDPPAGNAGKRRAQFRLRSGLPQSAPVALFLGRLHEKKGLDLLIPAFGLVSCRIPSARLLLVGDGDKSYVAGLRAAAARLADSVIFGGFLSSPEKWHAMAASDAFVLPSYQENFALAIAEALRAGLPVVLSRRVNLWRDVVEAGAGLACELTPESIAEQLVTLLKDAEQRRTFGNAGATLAAAKFSWRSAGDAADAIYREIRD